MEISPLPSLVACGLRGTLHKGAAKKNFTPESDTQKTATV